MSKDKHITRNELIENLKKGKQLLINPHNELECYFKYLSFFTKEKIIKKYANPEDIKYLTEKRDILEKENLFTPESNVTKNYIIDQYFYKLKPEYKEFDFTSWIKQKKEL